MNKLKDDKMSIPCFSCFCYTRCIGLCCLEPFTAPNIFRPNKIDVILHERFFKLCSLEEQYSLAFSVPEIFKKIKLKPLKVFSSDSTHALEILPNRSYNICVNGDIALENIHPISNTIIGFWLSHSILDDSESKNELMAKPEEPFYYFMFFKALKIVIRFSELSTDEFLHLLSCKTEVLECWDLVLTSKCKFSQILSKIPNITEIQLSKTNIDLENTWPEDLYRHKNGNNFTKLDIVINEMDYDFNVEYLVAFMKKKCHPCVQIYLYFAILKSNSSNHDFLREPLTKKFSAHFLSVDTLINSSFVCVNFAKIDPVLFETYAYEVFGCFISKY